MNLGVSSFRNFGSI